MADSSDLKRTPIADRHVAAGAKMVDFSGWYMPVNYKGIIEEHHTVRNNVGVFDLGHMGQLDVTGSDAEAFLQYVTTNDVSKLEPGKAQYAMLLYPDGGVVDDIIVYKRPDDSGYFIVLNAANTQKDIDWVNEQKANRPDLDATLDHTSDRTGMIAIQGPNAEKVMQAITDKDLSPLENFAALYADVDGVPCMVGRTGYTGEDGFEVYSPIDKILQIWDALFEAGKDVGIQPIGLGARDTLRLESKMALYGQELSPEITPLEARLGWAVKFDKGDFIGRDALSAQREEGLKRRLVGFKLVERGGTPRTHYEIQADGKTVGEVTSGSRSPTLGENIGLGLVDAEYAGVGKPLDIIVRGKPVKAEQVRTPFYKREN
ncbi:MAG: glycine cleavage system aminomethyltransferase GcvT [Thermomicrobiaceae bacterium]